MPSTNFINKKNKSTNNAGSDGKKIALVTYKSLPNLTQDENAQKPVWKIQDLLFKQFAGMINKYYGNILI